MSIENAIGRLEADNDRNRYQLAELFRQSGNHTERAAEIDKKVYLIAQQMEEAIVTMNGFSAKFEGVHQDLTNLARSVSEMRNILKQVDAVKDKAASPSLRVPDFKTSVVLALCLFCVTVSILAIMAPEVLPDFIKATTRMN